MPWKSNQQRKWGHTKEGVKALGGPSKVAEWDASSKGLKLPQKLATGGPAMAGRVTPTLPTQAAPQAATAIARPAPTAPARPTLPAQAAPRASAALAARPALPPTANKFVARPMQAQYLRGGPVQAEKKSWAKLSAPTKTSDPIKSKDVFRTDGGKQAYGKAPGTLGSGGRHGPGCGCSRCKVRFS